MKVIGLTNTMQGEAEQRFAGTLPAWMAELKQGRWKSWAELLRHYPRARRTTDDEAHFPLAADGAGIRASVFFHPFGLLRMLRVATSPDARISAPRRTAVTLSHPKPIDAKNTL